MSTNPINDTTTLYQVYFEVSDPAQCLQTLAQSALASSVAGDTKIEKFGFSVSITNQTIPEAIKILTEHNHAIYQVRRQTIAADIGYMI